MNRSPYQRGTPDISTSTRASHDSTTTFRQFSPSRRFFCLFTAFDFLFTLLAWVIYAHAFVIGLDKSLENEVIKYKIKESLFDIVLLSLWRMVVLLLAYALFVSRRWYVIAITTAVSTGFLLVKVFKFDFTKTQGHPMDYLIVIISLILCWTEALFLDFKVFPAELSTGNIALSGESFDTTAGERRPLISETLSSYHTPTWLTEHSTFYTPYGSQPSSQYVSEDEDEPLESELSPQDKVYRQRAKEVFGFAWELLTISDEWKLEKEKDDIIVKSCFRDTGKLFKVQCSLDLKPSEVFSLIVLRVEDGHKWNTSVVESKVLHIIDKCTDICYNVTAEVAGGMVSSRDFVNLRHWQKRGNAYFSSNVSVEYAGMPPVKHYVRGENHPGGWLFAEKEGHHDKTDFVMIVNTDLKGWLPQYLIDQAMTGVLFGTADCLRTYINHHSKSEEQIFGPP